MAYHKYIACFCNVPFTIPTPYDCNLGKLSGGIPGNTTANNTNFYNFFAQQTNGYFLQPGDFFKLQDAFYPQTYTCYQYIGTSITPETYYVEYQGGMGVAPSNKMAPPTGYNTCNECEVEPWLDAHWHSWKTCGQPYPHNAINTSTFFFGCPLPNTKANNQYFFDQLTAMIGTINIGTTIQLSDGTCVEYEGPQQRTLRMDIDLTNNPGSGLWHSGFAAGTGGCGNAIPPTRGLIGNGPDCAWCPSVSITTTLTTIAPITTTTTTCHNCCTTTTTGEPCMVCGIESCCDPTIQYNAIGNLLTLLNTLQCDPTYAFQIPNLLVNSSVIQNECWKPVCEPFGLGVANMVETYSYLTSNGLLNNSGCAGLSAALINSDYPCCVTTTTVAPTTTTTTEWYECITPAQLVPGIDASPGCGSGTSAIIPAGVNLGNNAIENRGLFIDQVNSSFGPTTAYQLYYFINPTGIPISAGYVCNNLGTLYGGAGIHESVQWIQGASTNTIFFIPPSPTWDMVILFLNMIAGGNSFPQDFINTDTWSQTQTKIDNKVPGDSLDPVALPCSCFVSCYCIPCNTPGTYPCVYNDFVLCDTAANPPPGIPCCQPITTTTTTSQTTTTTTTLSVGIELCCYPYDQYLVPNGSLFWSMGLQFLSIGSAHVFVVTLPNGSSVEVCAKVINTPSPINVITTGLILISPSSDMDCYTWSLDLDINSGYGHPGWEDGCCPLPITTTTTTPGPTTTTTTYPPTTTTTTGGALGVEECCSPFTQYVATGTLLLYLQNYNIGDAYWGTLSGPSTVTPWMCFKIISNPVGLILDTGSAYGPEDNCVDIDTFVINDLGLAGCCPTTTTTTYPPTTTTTTSLCGPCDVLFVDESNPPNIYNYNHTTNQTNLLFTATVNLGQSLDIARYGNLIWVTNGLRMQEYSIDPVTCYVTWVREIVLPETIGAGLTAIDSTTLIGGSTNAIPPTIVNVDITTNTAVVSVITSLSQTPLEYVAGDLLYLAGTNTFIAAIRNVNTGSKLNYYDLASGTLLATINQSTESWGLYCYNNNVYGITDMKDVYPIYVTSSSIVAGSPLQVVPNPPLWVWGAASDPDCCMPAVTTTTTIVQLGIALCCDPTTMYVASGSLLVYISGIPIGEAFAAWFVIGIGVDAALCVKVINNASGPIMSNFSPICNPGGLTCDTLNTHLINYIPPGHGVAELENGCCPPTTTTTTGPPVVSAKWIRACCPSVDGGSFFPEYAAIPLSNLDSILNGTLVGIVLEFTITPQGGVAQPSQCYRVTSAPTQPYSLADGYTTLMSSFTTCNNCNGALPVPPHSCVF